MTQIVIDIPADQIKTITDAFLSGDTTPYSYEVLGGEEFRRLIGVDMDSPVNLAEVSSEEALALVEACIKAFIRQAVARDLNLKAEREAQVRAAEAAAALL